MARPRGSTVGLLLPMILITTATSLPPATVPVGGQALFLDGINLSWKSFGTDVGSHPQWGRGYDSAYFDRAFADLAAAGGNAMRWWVHCDGRSSPEFDAQGLVTGLDPDFFPAFDGILASAARHGVRVMPALWSFDLAKDFTASAGPYAGLHIKLITDTAYTSSYIRNALIPMVTRYRGHAGLLAWEICNEPEWMLDDDGSTDQRCTRAQLQRFHGLLAAAIHRADPGALVTTGSASFKWCSPVAGAKGNYWSDSALRAAAGGDALARLDFYQIHYYAWMRGAWGSYSPFDFRASHWQLDKPIIIGEFAAKGEPGYRTVAQMYRAAGDSGYAGAFAWTYGGVDDNGAWADAKPGVEAAAAAWPSLIRPSTALAGGPPRPGLAPAVGEARADGRKLGRAQPQPLFPAPSGRR